jgi:hypothetical protein
MRTKIVNQVVSYGRKRTGTGRTWGGEMWKRGWVHRARRCCGRKFSRIEIPHEGDPIPELWWARVRAPESRDERSARGSSALCLASTGGILRMTKPMTQTHKSQSTLTLTLIHLRKHCSSPSSFKLQALFHPQSIISLRNSSPILAITREPNKSFPPVKTMDMAFPEVNFPALSHLESGRLGAFAEYLHLSLVSVPTTGKDHYFLW